MYIVIEGVDMLGGCIHGGHFSDELQNYTPVDPVVDIFHLD